jgi:hypothetical protein
MFSANQKIKTPKNYTDRFGEPNTHPINSGRPLPLGEQGIDEYSIKSIFIPVESKCPTHPLVVLQNFHIVKWSDDQHYFNRKNTFDESYSC